MIKEAEEAQELKRKGKLPQIAKQTKEGKTPFGDIGIEFKSNK